MRQTVGFHATTFDCHPVEFEIAEGEEGPEPGSEPAAMLRFVGGENIILNVPISVTDAEGMMGAFTEASRCARRCRPRPSTGDPTTSGCPRGCSGS